MSKSHIMLVSALERWCFENDASSGRHTISRQPYTYFFRLQKVSETNDAKIRNSDRSPYCPKCNLYLYSRCIHVFFSVFFSKYQNTYVCHVCHIIRSWYHTNSGIYQSWNFRWKLGEFRLWTMIEHNVFHKDYIEEHFENCKEGWNMYALSLRDKFE